MLKKAIALVAMAVAVKFTIGFVAPDRGIPIEQAKPASSTTPTPTSANARPTVPDDSGGSAAARTAAVRDLLDRHAAALLHRDRAAFLATVDPRATAFRAAQARLFANLAQVPLGTWQYLLDPSSAEPVSDPSFARYGGPVWAPKVTLRYSLRGFDSAPTERPQFLTFVRRAGRWYLASDSDFDRRGEHTWRGLWDFGPVVSYRGAASLVLAHPDRADRLASFAATADSAVQHVTRVWGTDWTRRVVVLIPDTQQELSHLLGDDRTLTQIAAVATADVLDPVHHTVRGQRVLVNPRNIDQLNAAGRRIVLRHEITHVATRAATGQWTPTWLMEGFADYVGYLGTGVPVTVAARELGTEVRKGRVPSALPSSEDFDGDNPRLSESYEEAWLACRALADRIGQAGLVRFYRMVGAAAGGPREIVGRALQRAAHLSYNQFVADWRHLIVTDLS